MSRTSVSTAIIAVLSVTVFIQGWILFERRASEEDKPDSESNPAGSVAQAPSSDSAVNDIAVRLDVIDARLMAIERALPTVQADVAHENRTSAQTQQTSISPQAAALADRRLASMFPDTTIDQEDMMRFQAMLADAPAEERVALTAAMTRAINDGRVRLRM
ncbi:MAG: hypothetical protein E6Q88_05165 [Lysobacteraceae bacterium]|nr:MAG: hypothetical protein E6Q88_05165 [Xanthomonadaceae bacterium]